ncbi:MAG: DUF2809 domain-containing protein [Clostridia bacterium]|nr:DUF2809 domain-containing protein [Clostridia bacterium]
MKHKKLRVAYLIAFFALLCIEILIGAFVHDAFVRPYVGDVLVVILIYCLVRIFKPTGIKLLPLCVFFFALMVELLQLANIVDLLGIPHNSIIAIMVGTSFSFIDIICYAVGCIIVYLTELIIKKRP